ncbi:MAG: CPBP family intramembrane metalloprotease [Deltaproteobacteria bacterium]|nr:CPBP family intramembrane metalloprotease [Deltaproteobacteria bacterium]
MTNLLPGILAALIKGTIELLIVVPFIAIAFWRRRLDEEAPLSPLKGIAFLVILCFLNTILMYLPRVGPFQSLYWHWQGKLLGIMLSLLFIFAVVKMPSLYGIRLPIPGSRVVTLIAIAGCVVSCTAVVLLIGPGVFSGSISRKAPIIETALFLWFMPGIDEELFYRCVILTTVDRLFGQRWKIGSLRIGWGAPISLMLFWFAHFVRVTGTPLQIYFVFPRHPFDIALMIIVGCLLTWGRVRTGSVLLSVIFHGVGSGIGPTIALLRGGWGG